MIVRSRRLRGLLVATAIVIVGAPLGALPAAAQSVDGVTIVESDLSGFPEVRLAVAVAGASAVEELNAETLTVTENGAEVDAQVRPLSGEAVDISLVIDVSGSMAGDAIDQAKVAATSFVDGLPDDARVSIISFGNTAQTESDFTADRAASRAAIDALDDGGETALYDGVILAAEQIRASAAERKAIVVLSDGGDTVSSADLPTAVQALTDTETDFFAVSLQTGEADEAALAALAEAAGGQVVSASDPDALELSYIALSQRIVNQYEIRFTSVTPDAAGDFVVTVDGTGDTDSVRIALPDRDATATTTATETTAPATLTSVGSTSPLQQSWALYIGAFLVIVAIGVTAYAVAPDPNARLVRRSLRADTGRSGQADADDTGVGPQVLGSMRDGLTRLTDAAVARSEQGGAIDARLDRAGLVMRAGEFVAAVVAVALAAALVLFLLLGPIGLLIGALVPPFGAKTFLDFLAGRRKAQFGEQLGDTLMLMAGSLRSGFGIGQAIDSVAEEMDPPIGTEFRRAVLETRLGRDVEDALQSIANRVENEDFEWVIDAMRIHRQVGGDLAEILDQVAETIRARARLRRQIAALTAEGRMSAAVLGIMPVAIAALLFTSNPDYLRPLFTRTGGQIMLAVGVGLLVAGGLWLKKLIDVEV